MSHGQYIKIQISRNIGFIGSSRLRGRPLDIRGGGPSKNFEKNSFFLKNGEKILHLSSMYMFCYRKCEKSILALL